MIDVKNIKRERFDSFGGIDGNIYAAEPLVQTAGGNAFLEYQKGTDVFKVGIGQSWLANGNNDTIPYLHRLMYQRSSIHNSCVNIIGSLINGAGLKFFPIKEYMAKDENGRYDLVELGMSESQSEEAIKRARVFVKNTGMSHYVKDASNQLPLYGGYYGLKDYALATNAETFLRSLRIEKYFNMRLGSSRQFIDNKFQSTKHYLSNDWTNAVGQNPKPFSKINTAKTVHGQIFEVDTDDGMVYLNNGQGMRSSFFGRVTDYRDFYATPIYETLDALSYIDLDYMLSQKDYKGVQTGFSLEHIIVRYRSPMDDKNDEAAEKVKEKDMFKNYKGFDGEKTMMLWVRPNKTEAGNVEAPDTVKIITIPNDDNTKRYTALKDERNMKILSAHNIIAPETIGMVPTSSKGLSSQSEFLITAMEHLHWAVIEPYRQQIIDDVENMLFNAGIFVGVGINSNAINYRTASDIILNTHYGSDEIREKHGDAPMSDAVVEEIAKRTATVSNSQNF